MSGDRRSSKPGHQSVRRRVLLLASVLVPELLVCLWLSMGDDAAARAPTIPPRVGESPQQSDGPGKLSAQSAQRSPVEGRAARPDPVAAAANTAARPEPELPSFFEVGALLRSSLDDAIEQLHFSPRDRFLLGTPAGKRIAAEEFRLTGQRMDDLCLFHGTWATNIARRLAAAGFRGTERPQPGHEREYSRVWSSFGEFFLSHKQYPELPAIITSIRRLPSELRSAIIRRLEAIPLEKR